MNKLTLGFAIFSTLILSQTAFNAFKLPVHQIIRSQNIFSKLPSIIQPPKLQSSTSSLFYEQSSTHHKIINKIKSVFFRYGMITFKFFLPFLIMLCFGFIKNSYASTVAGKVTSGIDLYGRMPHDDWMFSNWRLTDPHLFKRSLTESIKAEIPVAFSVSSRIRSANEFVSFLVSMVYIVVTVGTIATLIKASYNASAKQWRREFLKVFGRDLSVKAVLKKGRRKGKELPWKGFIDYKRFSDDPDTPEEAQQRIQWDAKQKEKNDLLAEKEKEKKKKSKDSDDEDGNIIIPELDDDYDVQFDDDDAN